MALEFQTLSVPFGQGLDKKTDPKAVKTGKMLLLENGVFTEANRISKRPGYDSLTNKTFSPYTNTTGTLSAPTMIKSYNDELLCSDNKRFYSYSPNLGAWIDKGPYESIASTQKQIASSGNGDSQLYQSQAILGNYMLCVWQQNNETAAQQSIFACIIDITTGNKILPDTYLAGGIKPVALVIGGTTLGFVYSLSGNPNINSFYFTLSGNAVSYTGPVGIITDAAVNPNYESYDAAGTSTGGVLCYSTAAGLKTVTLDTSFNITHTASIVTAASAISVTVGSNGNIWVYGSNGASGSTIYYAVYSSTLSVVLAKTTLATAPASNYCMSVGSVGDSTTQQTVVYAYSTGNPGSSSTSAPVTSKSVTVTSAGVVTTANFTSIGPYPISKPYLISTTHYVVVAIPTGYASPFFTYAVFNMDSKVSTSSSTAGYLASKSSDGIAYRPDNSFTRFAQGFLSLISAISSTKISLLAAYLSTTSPSDEFESTLLMFDYNSSDSYQGLIANGQLLLNGGIVHMYDGTYISELNFNNYPEVATAVGGAVAGVIVASGTYEYIAIYQWTDTLNNLHSSATSAPIAATFSGGATDPTKIVVLVNTPIITTKDPIGVGAVNAVLYRTTQNGPLYYRVASLALVPGTTSWTYTDNTSDTALVANQPLYTNGSVLSNDPPPPSMIMNTHNNRVFAVDSTNNNNVWYSKTTQQQVGISFSGNLLEEVDSKGGGIAGLAELDDKEVLFKTDSRIAILYGDGANDTGNGSTFSTPQFIQTDVGCSISKSIISQPTGIIFKSPKGWYLLDRSTSVQYIGYEVEGYNTQDVTSAVRLPKQTRCTFLTSSGSTLCYDYFMNQWSVFTNHTGVAGDVFQNLYTYLRTDGAVYQQNDSTFLDNTTSYTLRAQTAWLKMSAVQGFQRVRKVLLLGDHLSPVTGHGVKISAAYDFGAGYQTGFSTPVPYTFSSTAVFQYREGLPQQKCDGITLLIEEINASSGQTGEFIDLTDLGFEAGLKRGPNKLKAAQSVG